MWIRIRAVIIEDNPLAAQYLAALLDDTCQVEVVGSATESETGMDLCAELRPDAVFVRHWSARQRWNFAGEATGHASQPPHLVFTTAYANRAIEAFRLKAVDYLLKPLDPEQFVEAVNRLLSHLRPFESEFCSASAHEVNPPVSRDKMRFTGAPDELLPVKDTDRGKIRLLARHEVVAVIRLKRRSWIHTVREEFATYYPLAILTRWLGGDPFVQIGNYAVVNLHAIASITHYGDRLYRVRLHDRLGTEIKASRSGAKRLAKISS
jgi:DNA-binding LytR/AlgR family response regulator